MTETEKLLFICIENAGRSQMAEAFFRKYASGNFEAKSAGTKPESKINPIVAQAMNEIGIDLYEQQPKPISNDMIKNSTITVNMGCMDKEACPALFVKKVLDWDIPDPKGKPIDEVRKIRDVIQTKVKNLVQKLEEKS